MSDSRTPSPDSLVSELRPVLLRRLEELRGRVGTIDRDLRAAHDDDWAERAVEIENDQVLEELDAAVRAEAGLILRALRRMENGHYGPCAFCGQPIDEARLRVVPATAACRACAVRGQV